MSSPCPTIAISPSRLSNATEMSPVVIFRRDFDQERGTGMRAAAGYLEASFTSAQVDNPTSRYVACTVALLLSGETAYSTSQGDNTIQGLRRRNAHYRKQQRQTETRQPTTTCGERRRCTRIPGLTVEAGSINSSRSGVQSIPSPLQQRYCSTSH